MSRKSSGQSFRNRVYYHLISPEGPVRHGFADGFLQDQPPLEAIAS
ncbi:MAG: hypothetical protein ACRBN8_38970 [Nannocystales bacterium]